MCVLMTTPEIQDYSRVHKFRCHDCYHGEACITAAIIDELIERRQWDYLVSKAQPLSFTEGQEPW